MAPNLISNVAGVHGWLLRGLKAASMRHLSIIERTGADLCRKPWWKLPKVLLIRLELLHGDRVMIAAAFLALGVDPRMLLHLATLHHWGARLVHIAQFSGRPTHRGIYSVCAGAMFAMLRHTLDHATWLAAAKLVARHTMAKLV